MGGCVNRGTWVNRDSSRGQGDPTHESGVAGLQFYPLGKAVPHPPHRLHESGRGGLRLDLVAETIDVRVHRVAVAAVLVAPNLVEQLLAAVRAPRIPGKKQEQFVLLAR